MSEHFSEAEALSEQLELPLIEVEHPEADFLLVVTGERLELHKPASRTKPLYVDFGKVQARARRGRREPLVRAVGVKAGYRPSVVDVTAGLGQDAFILASAGCEVLMLERSPVVGALLEDALRRAEHDPDLRPVLSRMTLKLADARQVLPTLTGDRAPDGVYLDPMYPETGKTAAKRKSMQFFRDLVGDDVDAAELSGLARAHARNRVVVKRPAKAPPLGGAADLSYRGKTVRFDVYLK